MDRINPEIISMIHMDKFKALGTKVIPKKSILTKHVSRKRKINSENTKYPFL
jgi:hypothetical protein